MKRATLFLICLLGPAVWALSQAPQEPQVVPYGLQVPGRPDRAENFKARTRAQNEAMAVPFRGVTTDGNVIGGLYGIRSTGVSTAPVREAADAFLAGLSQEQRARTTFPVDDIEWRRWDNRPVVPRMGVKLNEMSERQRDLAFGLVRAGLSAKGLKLVEDVMKLNETIAELQNDWEIFAQWYYWITVMGEPSDSEPWGWQLDGHHLVINFFVLGDQVVMTPRFFGSEPVRADAGRFRGTVILQDVQNMGMDLLSALDSSQQAEAILGEKTGSFFLAGAYEDNLVLDYAGIPATSLNDRQQGLLLDLIAEWVSTMKEEHARVRMEEIRSHLDQTYFAWIGNTDPEGVFYYRIQSPVILIEFDHQETELGGRNHIHSVVRTPNGNDYGKDLLRQHYESHPHGGN